MKTETRKAYNHMFKPSLIKDITKHMEAINSRGYRYKSRAHFFEQAALALMLQDSLPTGTRRTK